jgi:formate dehydrogenase iron-sulfur subunit
VDRIISTRTGAVVPNARLDDDLALLDELCDTMFNGSLCGLGGMTPFPVRSALTHFREDFQRGH